MKKKIIFIIAIVFLLGGVVEGRKNYQVDQEFYKSIINIKFQNYEIKHKKAEEVIKQYFGDTVYKVILSENYGYEDKMIYFAVEEYMPEKYYNAIKKGIAVDEDGNVEVFVDTNQGIYSENNSVIKFDEIGIKKEEVKCIVLYLMDFQRTKKIKNYKTYWVSLIDQEDNNINSLEFYPASDWLFTVEFSEVYVKRQKVINQFNIHKTKEDLIKWQKEKIEAYRKAKAQGKAVKSAAVKAEFDRLKKAGLVEE